MRSLSTLLVSLALFVPVAAHAEDAGLEDASVSDASGPDASADDVTQERCLDGYDRSYIEACSAKQPGAACRFPGGEPGACAVLRCVSAEGAPILLCVPTTGMPAPPPRLLDAGLADADAGRPEEFSGLGGGGCAVSAPFAWGSLLWPALALLAVRARRRF